MVLTGEGSVFRRINDKIPARLVLAIMSFIACFFLYMLRVNISITIIAMTPPPAGRNETQPNYGPRYEWSEKIQGDVLASFSYGYFILQFPGGMAAEIFGARFLVFACMLIMGVFALLTPISAELHWGVLMFVRVVAGLAGGAIYPALHSVISRWAPPEEKSKFVWALLGGTFGTVVTMPLVGWIVSDFGWPAAFYVCGTGTLLFAIAWVFLIYDSPSKHPRITEKEKEYIHSKIGEHVEKAGRKHHTPLPIRKVLTSIPFLALVVCHFGNLWGLFFLTTLSPKFMSDILGFDLKASGGLSSLPHLARLGFGLIFSSLGDYIVKHRKMSRTVLRKVFIIFSHFLPGALLFAIGYIGDYVYWVVAALTMSLGFNGAASVTNLANHHDLAPNFAGSLYGIMNAVGTTTGFIIPTVSGRILQKSNTLMNWQTIFTIGAGMYFVAGAVLILFGSAEMQSWNFASEKEEKEELKKQSDLRKEEIPVKEGHVPDQSENTKI